MKLSDKIGYAAFGAIPWILLAIFAHMAGGDWRSVINVLIGPITVLLAPPLAWIGMYMVWQDQNRQLVHLEDLVIQNERRHAYNYARIAEAATPLRVEGAESVFNRVTEGRLVNVVSAGRIAAAGQAKSEAFLASLKLKEKGKS